MCRGVSGLHTTEGGESLNLRIQTPILTVTAWAERVIHQVTHPPAVYGNAFLLFLLSKTRFLWDISFRQPKEYKITSCYEFLIQIFLAIESNLCSLSCDSTIWFAYIYFILFPMGVWEMKYYFEFFAGNRHRKYLSLAWSLCFKFVEPLLVTNALFQCFMVFYVYFARL